MGRAAAVALAGLGCRVAMTSRGPDRLKRAGEALGIETVAPGTAGGRRWDVLVNATPAGSLRDPKGRAVEPAWAAGGGVVVETNYPPSPTALVREARERGLATITGDAVYAAQAAAQLGLFLPGAAAPAEAAEALRAATAWALAPNASS
jgi:shikimate 5-dehydrogenase